MEIIGELWGKSVGFHAVFGRHFAAIDDLNIRKLCILHHQLQGQRMQGNRMRRIHRESMRMSVEARDVYRFQNQDPAWPEFPFAKL